MRSNLKWYAATTARTDYVKRLQRTDLQLNDEWWNIGNIFVHENEGFYIQQHNSRILPYLNAFQNAITYELNLSQEAYYRRVYSILDFLRDIGGLFSALAPIFFGLNMIFNYRSQY